MLRTLIETTNQLSGSGLFWFIQKEGNKMVDVYVGPTKKEAITRVIDFYLNEYQASRTTVDIDRTSDPEVYRLTVWIPSKDFSNRR